MAKKRSYDLNTLKSEYEETLEQQDKRDNKEDIPPENIEANSDDTASSSNISSAVPITRYEDDYVNPDQEEYKRISLFMEWDTWERIQALCWNENRPVNSIIVDKLREWSLDIPDETLNKYRSAMKQKHLDEWTKQRDVLQYWWQTSGLRDQMNIKSFQMNKNSLTIIENTGTVRNYYIHRGWITDGQNKFAKEKIILAQLKRMK
jgi:hypothetical protein